MQIQDTLTLTVLDMNSEGNGICKDNGMVIFVPGTVPGEVVEAEIQAVQKNFASAVCRKIITPSPHRREPDCEWYNRCGGCSLRHVSREQELTVKENTVRQALRRMHLDRDPDVFKKIRAGEETGYRNKAVFHINKWGKIGYYARETHTVMQGSFQCRLIPPIFESIAMITEHCFAERPDYPDMQPEALYLRRNHDNQCSVCIQTAGPLTDHVRELLEDYAVILRQYFPDELKCVLHCDHPAGKYAVPVYTVISRERYLYETYHDLTMRISPEGFCQVNHKGAEILAETVLQYARQTMVKDTCTAADLYCGSGFFGLHLAKAFPAWQIYGIEINPDSIRDAEVNRELNSLQNIKFVCGDAADLTKKIGTKPDFAVIDPPRAGCSEKMCRQLIEMYPQHIAYVSCNPQTLARDLKRFVEAGYVIKNVQPVDMFPGTEHVETVCLLSKLNTKQHIEINLDMDELDLTDAEKKATYQEIKDYVLEHSGLKVSSLYIAQVKQKCGIIERENYNKPKSEDAKQPQCPPDKEKAIKEALKHFGMI